jgi:DNA-binding NtrC family response regulator
MPHKVLIVDDDHHILEMVANALFNEPYTVITAESAEEALALLDEEPVDLILSDEMMPGMPGSDFLAIVRKKYPDAVRMMFTSTPTLELAIKAINDGHVYHFFEKPVKAVDLIVNIRRALSHKDLLAVSRLMLKEFKKQKALLKHLEEVHPGISRVERDESGAIVIDEGDRVDWDELVKEINEELEEEY